MKGHGNIFERASCWQLVFMQSKVNGALYAGEELPGHKWDWPKNTYLQRRLQYIRRSQVSDEFADLNRSGDLITIQEECRN